MRWLLLYENLDICFCYVVGNDVVLGYGGELLKGCVVVLVAFDPDPFDCDRKLSEFRSDVTKKIEVRLLGFKGLCAGDCL